MNTMKTFLLRTIFLCVAFAPGVASAAVMSVVAPSSLGVGDTILAQVHVDTQGQSLNTFAGDFTYPAGALSLKEIRTGDSIISFWVDEPKAGSSGAVHFSGIVPGGIIGQGALFEAVLTVTAPGSASLSIENAQGFYNDGKGTAAPMSSKNVLLALGATPTGTFVESSIASDHTPPETFAPKVEQSPTLFDGARFVVFATEDKQSGVDHYEVAERVGFKTSNFVHLSWRAAESPERLEDQAGHAYVYVRAIDRAGNARVAVLSPEHLLWYYNLNILGGILIVLLVLALLVRGYVLSRKE